MSNFTVESSHKCSVLKLKESTMNGKQLFKHKCDEDSHPCSEPYKTKYHYYLREVKVKIYVTFPTFTCNRGEST